MIFNLAQKNRSKIAKKRKKAINKLTSYSPTPFGTVVGQDANQSNWKW